MASIYKTVVKDLDQCNLDFRINDLDESLEIKSPDGWVRLDDTYKSIATLKMKELGYGGKEKPAITTLWEAITAYAHSNRYNPILDYLDQVKADYQPQLNENDSPQPYLIRQFCEHFFDNPDGAFPTWLLRFLVGAVSRARGGDRNPMLVLGGKQRVGKSKFSEWLCPIPRRFVRGAIQPDNKDHKIRQATNLLWEVDELGSTTRRRDSDALKSFISLSEIYERKPFGSFPILKTARCSFIGTANLDGVGFLNDPTGSTRFLACEIDGIDWQGYTKNYSPDQLWAEASWFQDKFGTLYQSLTPDEEELRKAINARYEIQSALGEVIENLFEITHDDDHFLTTQQIQDICLGHYRINSSQAFYNELARVLKKHGIERHKLPYRLGGKRGWRGIKKAGEI